MNEPPVNYRPPDDRAEASDVAISQLMEDHQGPFGQQAEQVRRVLEFHRALLASTPRVFVTQAIVAVNVAVFVVMVALGVHFSAPTSADMIAWGANYGPMTTGGQWWRLLTCMFLHFGFIHLFFNMYVLWGAGQFVERLLGNVGFLVLYLLSGLAGSLASVYWNPDVVSAGASGAVFGVFGGLLGYLVRRPDAIPSHALAALRNSVLTFVGYNVFFGLMVPQIDMMAHGGGFAGGFVCALAMGRRLTPAGVAGRSLVNVAATVVGIGLVALGIRFLPQSSDDFLGAERHFSANQNVAQATFNAAVQRHQQGKIDDAQLADVIEREVLPQWATATEPLMNMKRVPAKRAEFVAMLRQFIQARQDGWRLLAEALREQDVGKLAESKKQSDTATALLKKLNQTP